MKNKHLLFAMALPALLAACADDNFTAQSNPGDAQGEFITLPANFALVQDNEGAQTKGAWNTNDDMTGSFYWMPEKVAEGSDIYAPDRIGLAWTGVSLKDDGTVDPVGSALTSYSDRVFTNYKFEHFAWRIHGVELKADPCNPNTWLSGAELLQDKYFTADWRRTSTGLPDYKEKLQYKNVDLNTGLFNTDNSTVYAGQYIVYAPYDAENVSNYIIASSKNVYEGAYLYNDDGVETSDADTKGKVWEYNDIFVYGTTAVGGGDQLTTFNTKNLHGYVSLALKGEGTIKKVILYDAEGRLLTKVGLSAKGIYEGKTGKDLYLAAGVAERETTTTITVEMDKRGKNKTYPTLNATSNRRVLIPVLPTESALDNVEIILVNDNDEAFRTTVSSLSIESNKPTLVTIDNVDFTNCGVLVTDEIALRVATGNQDSKEKVEKQMFATDAADQPTKVELLGDIELTTTLAIRGNYTLNGGRIIIPGNNGENLTSYSGAEIRMVVHNNSDKVTVANPVINSDILAKAAGCCKKYGGSLIVGNATINGDVVTENQASYADYEDYVDDLAADKSKHGMVKFNVTGATTTFAGTLVNNGRLDFGRSDRGASNTGTAAEARINVMQGASIVNNNQMTIFRYVVDGNTNSQVSPYVWVNNGGELSNNGVFTIEGKLAFQGTGKNNGVIYDRVSSTVTGNLINYNAEGAEYVCDVNDPGKRFMDAVEGRSKPTTTVRFVENYATYDFGTVNLQAKQTINKYVVDVEPDEDYSDGITLKGNIDLTGKDLVVEKGLLRFAQYVVAGGQTVNSELKAKNVDVNKDGCLVMRNVNANIANSVTVSGELFAETDKFNIGSTEQKGKLTINAYTAVDGADNNVWKYGYMECRMNSVTTVYGSIVNEGHAVIIEATGTAGSIPAYLYYTDTMTGDSDNWIRGSASKM